MEAKSNLEKMELFFSCDIRIKNAIGRIAFDSTKIYDSDYAMKYSDDIYKELKYIKDQFLIISSNLFGQYLTDLINKKFEAYNQVLINCGTDPIRLQNFYRHCISVITPQLAQEVKRNCVGYYLFGNIYKMIDSDISINGLLHILHSSVMNNDSIYHAVEVLAEQKNKSGWPICLRGDKSNSLAFLIYENFPLELDCGDTDILGLHNKTLIMIRDIGHALTIELEETKEGIMIRYFIPKLCNISMINALPGINKVSEHAELNSGARGEFLSSKESIVANFNSFISRVPTDADLPQIDYSSLFMESEQQKR